MIRRRISAFGMRMLAPHSKKYTGECIYSYAIA
jgi:hypothetical protein